MAYALYCSSCIMLALMPEAKQAVDWLEKDARSRPDGVGWGLPFSWDAFSDGYPNPLETTYGITSALSVRAIVDFALAQGLPIPKVVTEFLDRYLQYSTATSAGRFFWYSDQPGDAKSVFNVTAMLAGQYARVGRILGREEYCVAAHQAALDILSHCQQSPRGDYWAYGPENPRPNDLVHAAYTLQGLVEVERQLTFDFGLQRAKQYLRKFVRLEKAFEFVRHQSLAPAQRMKPARLWGVGMLLYTAVDTGDHHLQLLAETALKKYEVGDCRYLMVPGKGAAFPRHEMHVLFGLSRASILSSESPCYSSTPTIGRKEI